MIVSIHHTAISNESINVRFTGHNPEDRHIPESKDPIRQGNRYIFSRRVSIFNTAADQTATTGITPRRRPNQLASP